MVGSRALQVHPHFLPEACSTSSTHSATPQPIDVLAKHEVPFVIIGGHAVTYHATCEPPKTPIFSWRQRRAVRRRSWQR